MEEALEILINASEVEHHGYGDSYEFVLDANMDVKESVKIESLVHGIISQIENPASQLAYRLFELNHVRVNPNADNTNIINQLTRALNKVGVKVQHPDSQQSVNLSFKPLGEINENVRFYMDRQAHIVFLSPANKLKLVGKAPEGPPKKPTSPKP